VRPIASAISRFEFLGLKTPEVLAKRPADQRGPIHSSPPGSSIRGAEQRRIQHDLNSLHAVEHTPQSDQQSIAVSWRKVYNPQVVNFNLRSNACISTHLNKFCNEASGCFSL